MPPSSAQAGEAMRSLIKRVELAIENLAFRRWQRKNPGASFKDYFANGVKHGLADGKVRASLGDRLKKRGFGELGKRTLFVLLNSYGLKPEDVCVDYGCGTLRMGVHAIKYLAPGKYVGMDIDQALIDQGIANVGPELIAAKRPDLAVISPEAVARAAGRSPVLVYSLKVLIHVHPGELEEYFRNLLTIAGSSGVALVTGKWSDGKTIQISKKSWLHSLGEIEAMVARLGGTVAVATEEDYEGDGAHKAAKSGRLEIRQVR
jgi:hypothetical protein